jgi:hypothetical protein
MSDIDLELDKQLEPILDRMWNGDYDKGFGDTFIECYKQLKEVIAKREAEAYKRGYTTKGIEDLTK